MDPRTAASFRVVLGGLLAVAAVSFAVDVPALLRTHLHLSSLQLLLSVVFWIAIVGAYATLYRLHVTVRSQNPSRGNGRVGAALGYLVLALGYLYIQLHVLSHVSSYGTLVVAVAAATLGPVLLIVPVGLSMRRRMREREQRS
jgi:hypothetical protein